MHTTITYIEHSCFLIETEDCYLLFDYFCGEQPLPALDVKKPLILFNSHAHSDHFSEKIFALRAKHPKCFFVLSDDIPVPEVTAIPSDLCTMAPHTKCVLEITENGCTVAQNTLSANADVQSTAIQDTVSVETAICKKRTASVSCSNDEKVTKLTISTLRSNDEGVAFLVELGDLRFYHAGDLNNWWWDGDAEDEQLAEQYHEELARIRGQHFSAAFIPLDPRLKGWWKGIEDFMHYADADALFPMHNFGEQGLPKKLLSLDCVAAYRDRIRDVEEPGTSFFL